eukprot:scaffold270_cov347-Pavlova_lutheri.AAC.37
MVGKQHASRSDGVGEMVQENGNEYLAPSLQSHEGQPRAPRDRKLETREATSGPPTPAKPIQA